MAKTLQKTTKGYNRERGLTTKQQSAIDLLVLGKSDQETADSIGVHRVTVTKWRNYDPHFQAALNVRRRDVFSTSADRLRSLVPVAVEVLEAELKNPENSSRGQLALSVLKAIGMGAGDIGPTTPDAVIERAVLANSNNEMDKHYGIVKDLDREKLLAQWEHALSAE